MNDLMQVGELAEASGVSIRTLHYYEAIGLLLPRQRTASGYRLYGETEVLRLQQILIRRELGISLNEIAQALDDPAFDLRRALLEQRAQLATRARDAERMIEAIDRALQEQSTMQETVSKLFDGFNPDEYEEEVRERWGDQAWETAQQRVSQYSEQDWQACKEETATIYRDAFALLSAGQSPESEAAMAVAEKHRASLDRWFYPCSYQKHVGLADLYESDARFAASIDQAGAGLTPFLVAAIRANARRQQG